MRLIKERLKMLDSDRLISGDFVLAFILCLVGNFNCDCSLSAGFYCVASLHINK